MSVNPQSKQTGFGLIEVLVALLIFALGILATYSIQVSALSAYHEANQLLVATDLGRDIIARIRSNATQLALYNVEELGAGASPTAPNCYVKSCSPAQLAQFDLGQLGDRLQGAAERVLVHGQERNAGGMADARACIRSSGRMLTVIISWSSRDIDLASEALQCGPAATQFTDNGYYTRSYVITSHIGENP